MVQKRGLIYRNLYKEDISALGIKEGFQGGSDI